MADMDTDKAAPKEPELYADMELSESDREKLKFRRAQRLIESVNLLFLMEVLAGFFLAGIVSLLFDAICRILFGVRFSLPAYQIIGSVILILWAGNKNISLKKMVYIERPSLAIMLLTILAGTACYILSVEIAGITMAVFSMREGKGTSALTASMLSALLNSLAAGVFEEVLFRGVMFPAYRQKSLFRGIWLSSLLFGMLHFNITQGVYAVVIGIFLCLTYYLTDNLIYPIVTHFVIDMQPILWLIGAERFPKLFRIFVEISESPLRNAEIWFLPAVFSTILLLLILAFMKKWKAEQDIMREGDEPAKQRKLTEVSGLKVTDTNLIAGLATCALLILASLLPAFYSLF